MGKSGLTTMGGDCGDESTGIGLVMIGMALAVLASVGSTFGLILQKLAQVQNDALPLEKQYTKTGSLICSPTWILGLVLLVAVPFPLDLVAFSLAPQSLVVPLTGVTLILNQVVAPFLLNEKVTCIDWAATGVITVGIVFTTAFGSHCSYEYTVDQMMGFFENILFQVAQAIFVLSMVFCWWWVNWGAESCCREDAVPRAQAMAYGYMSGAVGGQQQIFLKATGELFETSVGGEGEWDRWQSWMFAILCVLFAGAQIQLLNKGLGLWTAVKYLPLYNVCLILCSTTYGAIFYQEYKQLDTLGFIMFPLGVTIVISGAMVLTLKGETGKEGPTVAPDTPTEKTDAGKKDGLSVVVVGDDEDFKGRTDDSGKLRERSPLPVQKVHQAFPLKLLDPSSPHSSTPRVPQKPRWKSEIQAPDHIIPNSHIIKAVHPGSLQIVTRATPRASLAPLKTLTGSNLGRLGGRPVLAPITRPHGDRALAETTPTPGSEHRKRSARKSTKSRDVSPRKLESHAHSPRLRTDLQPSSLEDDHEGVTPTNKTT